MPNEQVNELITRLTTAQTVDTGRAVGTPFKLPATLRTDLDADLTSLKNTEADTGPTEGGCAASSVAPGSSSSSA